MEAMASWTDDRMDDLKGQVDALSHRVDEGFREQRLEMGETRKEMNSRFDALQRVLIMFAASMFGAMMSLVAAFVAFQL